MASGMALASKINCENNRAFVLLGDGECGEGSNWEAIIFAVTASMKELQPIIRANFNRGILFKDLFFREVLES